MSDEPISKLWKLFQWRVDTIIEKKKKLDNIDLIYCFVSIFIFLGFSFLKSKLILF